MPQQPRPAWVIPVNVDVTSPTERDEVSTSYTYFMHDFQTDIKSDVRYHHLAYKIFNNKGVENASTIYLSYDPSFQKLVLHSIRVYRSNTWEDRLKSAKIDVLQREEGLENSLYSGEKTVSVILKDIREGDIVEYDYSVAGSNPIFKKKFFCSFRLNSSSNVKYIRCRVIAPQKTILTEYYANYVHKPVIDSSGSTRIYTWEAVDIPGLKVDAGAPSWYEPYDLVEVSEYKSWKDVIDWGREVFKAAKKAPAGALSKKLEELRALPSPEKQVITALRYVQNNIRYFGIEIGVNSHQPKPPAEVIKDGFGDCKDKAFLFCSLLTELGIQAWPVLVNTEKRISLGSCAPSPVQFDHAIACVKLKNKIYYFDPTIPEAGGVINNFYTPNYALGLVLKDSVGSLARIPGHTVSDIRLKELFTVKSLKGDASLQVKTYYSGYDADEARYKFSNSNMKDVQDKYREYYESRFKDVEVNGKLKYTDDQDIDRIVSTENYSIKKVWDQNDDPEKLVFTLGGKFIKESFEGIDFSLKKRNAPLRIPYPMNREHIIEVQLPETWNIKYDKNTISNEWFYYFREITYVNNKLTLRYFLKTLNNTVTAYEYPKFKEDLNTMLDDLAYTLYWNNKLEKQTKSSNVNWIIVFLALMISILLTILYIYYYRRITSEPEQDIVPMRLGGWLLLPFIGVFLNILIIFFGFFTRNFFNKTMWLLRTDESSSDYISGFSALIIFELCVNLFFLFYSLFLVTLIVRYHRKVPKLMIGYYVIYLIFVFADHAAATYIFGGDDYLGLSAEIISRIIVSAIWIPYFLYSERVKETFVR
ncbi:MAG: DUF3857 domain-containing protein [Bacteroidia bacterium]